MIRYVVNGNMLVIGVGGAGIQLSIHAADLLGADCVTVSTDGADSIAPHDFLCVKCNMLANPSVHEIRWAAHDAMERLQSMAEPYDTIVMVANLAGRSGAALAPLISGMAGKRVLSFVVMPFGYEQDRLFQAGVALARVRSHSYSTAILDNDSMLQCNPDLSVDMCYEAGNWALLGMIGSVSRTPLAGDHVIAAGPENADVDESFRDAIKMLYKISPPHAVKCSILYVAGNVSVGMVDSISRLTQGITDAPVTVVAGASGRAGVVLVSSADALHKFEAYDPLCVIPVDRTLDWNEPESAMPEDLGLYQLE